MAYQPEFLTCVWDDYLIENKCLEADVDPDAFIRWTYARALAHRQPRFEAMAPWGVTLTPADVEAITDTASFNDRIAAALERRTSTPI